MDTQTFDNLIDGYVEDRLDTDQLALLEDVLRQSAEARQRFWEHGRLESYLVEVGERRRGEEAGTRLAFEDALRVLSQIEDLAEPALREVEPVPTPVHAPAAGRPARVAQAVSRWAGPWQRGLIAAAVAGLVLLLGLQMISSSNHPPVESVSEDPPTSIEPAASAPTHHAALVRAFDPRWDGKALAVGDALDPDTPYALTQGTIDLRLDTGALVTLRAPARFRVDGHNQLRLDAGRAFAAVPDSAVGFAVRTPQGRVVDLGTEFGVAVDGSGPDEVVVFKGLVEAVADDADASPVKIPENWGGTLQRGRPVGERLEPIDRFDTTKFVRDWEEVVYHPRVVAGVYHPVAPESLVDDAAEADYAQVFAEARGVVLDQPLDVIKLRRGQPTMLSGGAGTATVQAGTKVNAFLVQLDRPEGAQGRVVRTAELTFPGEVLGVICRRDMLQASDPLLGAPGTRYPTPDEPSYRGAWDPYHSPNADFVRLEADGKTVTVSLFAAGMDSVRILVRNTDDAVDTAAP